MCSFSLWFHLPIFLWHSNGIVCVSVGQYLSQVLQNLAAVSILYISCSIFFLILSFSLLTTVLFQQLFRFLMGTLIKCLCVCTHRHTYTFALCSHLFWPLEFFFSRSWGMSWYRVLNLDINSVLFYLASEILVYGHCPHWGCMRGLKIESLGI